MRQRNTRGISPRVFLFMGLRAHKKTGAALLSVLSNTGLVIAKLAIGLAIGSVSVISEAIHSGVDLIASVIAFFAVRNAEQPPDLKHSYGHGKFENLSGTIEALLILLAAGWIIREAVLKIVHPRPLETIGWGILIMLLSSLVNFGVSSLLMHVARRTDSIALKADALHHRTDVYTSAGVMVGLVLIWVSQSIFKGTSFDWIDPIAAILVSLLIIRAAWELTREAIEGLLDTALPAPEEDWIKAKIRESYPVVRSFHNFRSRKSGSTRFIEFHIKVDPNMHVSESHGLNDKIVGQIKEKFGDCRVMVHIEPCHEPCETKCALSCFKKDEERNQGSLFKEP
jgi:cation diffusion facilitator family transporter